jgi:nicotinamidase-related amidase
LVVVDLVPFFLADNPYVRGIVPHVNRLATAVRGAGGTVAWVVPADEEPSPARVEFYGPEVAEAYRRSGGSGRIADRLTVHAEVHAGDLMAEKRFASAYFPGSSSLPDQLEARGVDTLVVAGTVTNVCVESTVRDASTLGLRVVLVADACAGVDDASHNATLRTVYRSFGDVRSTDEVVGLLSPG